MLPIAARLLLLRDKALVSQVLRLFIRRVFAWQRRMAREMGIIDGQGAPRLDDPEVGRRVERQPTFPLAGA